MTQRRVTLKDICGYLMLENFIGHVCGKHIVRHSVDTTLGLSVLYSRTTSYYCALFNELRDQLASL